MRVYKPIYWDEKTGKKKRTEKWYVDFTDQRQIRRRDI